MKAKGENLSGFFCHMGGADGPVYATVIPVLNEREHIEKCLRSFMQQNIDPSLHMVMVLDGGSTDGTQSIIRDLQEEYATEQSPELVFKENPGRTVAHGRNEAMRHLPTSVQFLIEMIGHASVEPTHLEQRIRAWDECEGLSTKPLAGVGVKVCSPTTSMNLVETWIESALHSPFGQSGGQFSDFATVGPTQVPAFVMHRRDVIEAVGGWDEAYLTSQDSELSMRLLQSGYSLYRSPNSEVTMRKRTSLGKWWKMSHRYGFWRTKVLKKYPKRAKWKEFLPLIGLAGTLALALAGFPWWWLGAGLYAGVLSLESLRQSILRKDITCLVGTPLSLLILHTGFSVGLIDGLVRKGRMPSDRS